MTVKSACPACGAELAVPADAIVGEVIVCDHCGAELEMISAAPPVLEFYEDEEK
ncbi:MAG: lysine biosynthesis protein LysW [Anaerolineae bacterium]